MNVVLALVIALAVWSQDFVITAISSNVFLNMTIIGTFVFGLFLVYYNIFHLKNEFHALSSLQEEYADAQNRPEKEATDPLWRHYRCDKLAIVFTLPAILGQAYQMLSEEIGRNGKLNISTSTMHTLLESVDIRLDDQKSLITYVTGLLVFLGLIGTFIGLMITLKSVGEIIGALDLSSGSTETIQKLMDNLKTPLVGMATGFSSSLFGLITSLTLGLIGRFAAQAAGVLRMNFESWLAGVAQIEGQAGGGNLVHGQVPGTGVAGAGIPAMEVSGGGGQGGATLMEERQLQLMLRVARFAMASNTKVNRNLNRLTGAVTEMGRDRREQQRVTDMVMDNMTRLAAQQSMMVQALENVTKAVKSRDETAAVVGYVERRSEDRMSYVSNAIENVARQIEDLSQRTNDAPRALVKGDLEAERIMGELNGEIADLTVAKLREKLAQEHSTEPGSTQPQTAIGDAAPEAAPPQPKDRHAG